MVGLKLVVKIGRRTKIGQNLVVGLVVERVLFLLVSMVITLG